MGLVACLSRSLHFFFVFFVYLIIAQVHVLLSFSIPVSIVYRADLISEHQLAGCQFAFSFSKSSRRHQLSLWPSGFSVPFTADRYHMPSSFSSYPFYLLIPSWLDYLTKLRSLVGWVENSPTWFEAGRIFVTFFFLCASSRLMCGVWRWLMYIQSAPS